MPGITGFTFLLAALLICRPAAIAQAVQQPADAAKEPGLRITVLEGEGAFNNIRQRIGRNIRVEVRNQNNELIPGADVTFTAPSIGPSVNFGKNQLVYTAKTDALGQAVTTNLTPNGTEGRLDVGVTARSGDLTGRTSVAQSNTTAGGVGASAGGGGSKKALWVSLIGGAATGVIIGVTRGGGGSSSSAAAPPPPAPVSISVGTVNVGGPR